MSKASSFFIGFGVFSAVAYLFPKIFWFFGLLSSFFSFFLSNFCYLGFTGKTINEVSIAFSSVVFGFVVLYFYKKFFSG